MHGRRVVAWTSVTLDGYTSGPDGPSHDTWLYENVGQPQTAAVTALGHGAIGVHLRRPAV